MRIQLFASAALLLAVGCPLAAQNYIWTGELPTDFQGQLTPPNDGTANLYFGDSLNPFVPLSPSFDNFNSLVFSNGNTYIFTSASSLSLALATGIAFTDEVSGSATFNSNVNLDISGSVLMALAESFVYVRGQITGTGSLVLTGGPAGNGGLILSNTGSGNTYNGNTTLGDGSNTLTVAFWNSSPFGTGTVTLLNGGFLIAHGNDTVANNLVFNSVGSSNAVGLKSWDAPVTYSGTVTLDNNVTLSPKFSDTFIPAPLNDGSIPEPGPFHRNPIIFSGNVSESGGSRSVTVQGPGIVALTGTDTYSGGTSIDGAAGALIFGPGSVPATGSILVNQVGYLGTTDTTSAFSALLANVSSGSTGSFGVDSLSGTVTYSNPINLSTLSNSEVRIGTATSAILTGAITPQSPTAFQFGGGGGTLYVDTPLANGVATNVVLNNYGSEVPLTVYLQGVDTYTGSTTAEDGFLIFDGASSLPGSTTLTALGTSSDVGTSYIGYTDALGITPATFLGYFNLANTYGIIGFDAHTPGATVSITGPINLTGFNDGVFIGTSTKAILSGALTPATVANTYQSGNTLRFTAVNSGVLTVDTAIADNGSPVKVVLGVPNALGNYSSGTVILNASNTYTGGTTLNCEEDGLTLGIGTNSALGTGALTIANNSSGGGGIVGIEATTGGLSLPNAITFLDTGGYGSSQLNLVGTNNFTLSGAISSDISGIITLYNSTPISVTLSGNNSGYAGAFDVINGTLKFPTNTGAGNGNASIYYAGNATVDFTGAVAPILEHLEGSLGSLVLGSGTNLTIDSSAEVSNDSSSFGGVISGAGALTVTNNGSSYDPPVLLYGNNTYSGGTTITQKGLLVLGSNQGAGTGGVTVATNSAGAFALDSGVTYSGPLTFTSGNLAGFGTFDPNSAGLSGTVTVGPSQGVVPGFPAGNNDVVTGTLTFAGNMAFNNGGAFYWSLQDNSRVDGASQLDIAGNLTINATAGGFGLELLSYDATGAQNNAANFNIYAPYSWVIATTGGTIQNFNAADFVISAANFENGAIPASHFMLSVNGADNQLILNFTPVPEPSTYVLVALGTGFVGLLAFRRRRALPAGAGGRE